MNSDPFDAIVQGLKRRDFWVKVLTILENLGKTVLVAMIFVLIWIGAQSVLQGLFGGHVGWVTK